MEMEKETMMSSWTQRLRVKDLVEDNEGNQHGKCENIDYPSHLYDVRLHYMTDEEVSNYKANYFFVSHLPFIAPVAGFHLREPAFVATPSYNSTLELRAEEKDKFFCTAVRDGYKFSPSTRELIRSLLYGFDGLLKNKISYSKGSEPKNIVFFSEDDKVPNLLMISDPKKTFTRRKFFEGVHTLLEKIMKRLNIEEGKLSYEVISFRNILQQQYCSVADLVHHPALWREGTFGCFIIRAHEHQSQRYQKVKKIQNDFENTFPRWKDEGVGSALGPYPQCSNTLNGLITYCKIAIEHMAEQDRKKNSSIIQSRREYEQLVQRIYPKLAAYAYDNMNGENGFQFKDPYIHDEVV